MIKLVCPKCKKNIEEQPKSYPSYHNRLSYICPFCGYDNDSVFFEKYED